MGGPPGGTAGHGHFGLGVRGTAGAAPAAAAPPQEGPGFTETLCFVCFFLKKKEESRRPSGVRKGSGRNIELGITTAGLYPVGYGFLLCQAWDRDVFPPLKTARSSPDPREARGGNGLPRQGLPWPRSPPPCSAGRPWRGSPRRSSAARGLLPPGSAPTARVWTSDGSVSYWEGCGAGSATGDWRGTWELGMGLHHSSSRGIVERVFCAFFDFQEKCTFFLNRNVPRKFFLGNSKGPKPSSW